MHLILFVAGLDDPELKDCLNRAGRVLDRTLPRFPVHLKFDSDTLPEIRGGWLAAQPDHPGLRRRVHSWSDERIAVLVYGELFGVEEQTVGAHIAGTWASGGAAAVRDLDGCFSAIIVDRQSRRCTVVSDMIGRRTFRYCDLSGPTLLATHDLGIVATGLVVPSFDFDAIASAAAFGWSLGGIPFLANVHACQPDEELVWEDGRLFRKSGPRLTTNDRIAGRNASAARDCVQAMVSHLRRLTASFSGEAGPVKADLTAGLDSRCVLALLLSTVERSRITVGTDGQLNSLDVVVARIIAGRYGLTHDVFVHDRPDPERFFERLDILAFALNGDTDGKRALTDIFKSAEFVDPIPRLYGLASEIYRGYYYPAEHVRTLQGLRFRDVSTHLRRKASRIDRLPWKDAETSARLACLLEHRLQGYAGISDHPADLLDLFYVFERFCRWGSFSARATWWSHYFAPFASTELLKMAFRLPPPLGYGIPLHRAILRTHLKGAYAVPLVNGLVFPPATRFPALSRHLSRTISGVRSAAESLALRFRPKELSGTGSLDQWSAQQFGSSMRTAAEESLLSSGSLATKIMTEDGIRQMFQNISSGASLEPAVGVLIAAERWREQIERAWVLARGGSSG